MKGRRRLVFFFFFVVGWPATTAFLRPEGRPHGPLKEAAPSRRFLFDKLAESMASASSALRGKKRLTEGNIAKALKDVRRALLEADVNAAVVTGLIDSVKRKAVGIETSVEPSEQFVKFVYDELVDVMAGEAMAGDDMSSLRADFLRTSKKKGSPRVVLLCGLQGAGKTTAAAKLAKHVLSNGLGKPLLVAADVYRPAAIDQLKILGESIGVEVYAEEGVKDAVGVAKRGVASRANDDEAVVIVDTAGRQVVDDALMRELKDVQYVTKPAETLLVLDAMTGQQAATLCLEFNEACPLTGAVLTKLDGDARGGAALSVRAVANVPVKFVGVGEKVTDLEPFYPGRMASRVLGMGDVVSLVEQAEKRISKKDAEKQMGKLVAGSFDFDDYLTQANAVKDMGNFADVAKLLPGMGGVDPDKIKQADAKAKIHTSLVYSMTRKERVNPELLIRHKTATSRIKRIAKGAGRDLKEAQAFLAEFQAMRTMMARMAKGKQGIDPTAQQAGMPPGAASGPGLGPGGKKKKKKTKKAAAKLRPSPKGFA